MTKDVPRPPNWDAMRGKVLAYMQGMGLTADQLGYMCGELIAILATVKNLRYIAYGFEGVHSSSGAEDLDWLVACVPGQVEDLSNVETEQ